MQVCISYAFVALLVASCQYGRAAPATPVLLPTATPVRTIYRVQRGSVVDEVAFPGKIVLSDQQDLYFDVPGRIETIYVESGQDVAADQPIADLHAAGLQFDVADARMAVDLATKRVSAAEEEWRYEKQAAEVELAIAERSLEAIQSMVNPDPLDLFVQSQRVQQAQIEVDRLQRGVDPEPSIELERAELALERALGALAETRLTAPKAGQVRFLSELDQGTAVSPYVPIAYLVDPDFIQVEASLVASDLTSLYEGMPVSILPQNGPGTVLAGTISSLPQPFGTGTGTTTLIDIDSEDSSSTAMLRPGAMVDVTAVIAQANTALWIPEEALRGAPDRPHVVVNLNGELHEVEIEIGVRGDGRIEVRKGLHEGEEVVES